MIFCWSLPFPLHPLSCREVKLSVVSYLTNSIVDQILQELYTTHKTLVNTNHLLRSHHVLFLLKSVKKFEQCCLL